MRHGTLIGLAAALVACGVATTVTNDTADAQPRRGRPQPKQRPNAVRVPNFNYPGGMAGCFDPRLSGYPRAAAERAGGVPCDTPRRTRTNSAASPATTWIVGAWVGRGDQCGGEGWVVGDDGSYADPEGTGRWSLAGNILALTQLQRQVPTGEFGEYSPVYNPRPTRTQIVAHTPNAFSMRHASGAVTHWRRCR